MSFSFDATAGASQSTSKNRLVGNSIYNVTLDGCETQDITGVKDPSALYKVIKIKFSTEDGTYEHTVFEPRPDDFKRGENEITNKNCNKEKIPQPSNVESMMLLFKHIIDAFVPEIAKQIDNKEKSLGAKSWDELRKLIVTILDKGKGRKCNIKLIKDNKGEAKFPGFFASISKDGTAYIRNNFIGEKVAFTAYEADKINKEASAKPTSAAEAVALFEAEDTTDNADTSLNLDFSVL